ncbi:class I SAM-dependent methyltransferase [Lysobacter antibioticus]|uniref:class I SAM-dependent methyltransferase n=1 Tax=Lysobacter antibioticus TaxID=84531 RepID=UPI0007174A21|nr:class I SAM-dependent methyltransferase [Lysobacter antibioticus]
MSGADPRQRAHWDALSKIDPEAAVIDPNDRIGRKNTYLASIRDAAFRESLARYAVSKGKLLDLGCGSASATSSLLDAGHSVLGIDISTGLLRHAQSRCSGRSCLFVATDGKHLPVADDALDATVVYVVLSYIADDEQAKNLLADIRQALKPGAPLIMIEQTRTSRRVAEQGLKLHRSRQEWLALLRSAGFTIDRSSILRHGRFPSTPLIAAGLIPRWAWPYARLLEIRIASVTGVLPWDYAEVLFEARA